MPPSTRAGRLLETTIVGSYPQPEWLIDRSRLRARLPPRVRARELWRISDPLLQEAHDDATVVAIREMEDAGVDVITDGEIRRESYSNRFATSLDGLDLDNPGTALDRTGHPNSVPRVVGPIKRVRPAQVRDAEFLRRHTRRPIRVTVPGPFTMSQQAQDDYYGDKAALAMDYAAAVNEELSDLVAAGTDIVQIDEPYLQARPEEARAYALPALNRALQGLERGTALHTCFGYAAIVKQRASGYSFLSELRECAAEQISIEAAQPKLDPAILSDLEGKTVVLGVLDLGEESVESVDVVAQRIRDALRVVEADKLVVAPDCGMKYLTRPVAQGKLRAMVRAAEIVRQELEAA